MGAFPHSPLPTPYSLFFCLAFFCLVLARLVSAAETMTKVVNGKDL
jgi:hypothetical protein